jgi:hypothetical protein
MPISRISGARATCGCKAYRRLPRLNGIAMRWRRAKQPARSQGLPTEKKDPPADLLDPHLDDEQNRESAPPDDELIDLQCMFVAEGYLPAHVPKLLAGMRKVGWDREDPLNRSPFGWVQRSRESGGSGGWAPVGYLVQESVGGLGPSRQMDLPDGVDYAYAVFWAISPGLTMLTIQFVFTDDQALVLDGILRKTYSSFTTPSEQGWLIHDPGNQKRQAVLEARRELRCRCGQWLAERLPGAFAGGLMDGDWPAVDVLTAVKFDPLSDGDRTGIWDYKEILQLEGGYEVLHSSQVEDLRLRLPGPFDETAHTITAAGQKPKLFSKDRLSAYGDGDSRSAFASWLHPRLDDVAAGWGCVRLVHGYQAALSTERDRLTDHARDLEAETTLSAVSQLRRDLLPRARDAQILGAEVDALCEEDFAMPFRGLDWTFRNEHPDKRTLGVQWRDQCQFGARVLSRTESRLRDALATDAQLSVAAANLTLQKRVAILTFVSVGVAAVAAVAALIALLQA